MSSLNKTKNLILYQAFTLKKSQECASLHGMFQLTADINFGFCAFSTLG